MVCLLRHEQHNADQVLEKQYNKPAKGHSGIVGFPRRNEAVCKLNLIKHEKSQYAGSLENICNISNNDEYSIHYGFTWLEQKTMYLLWIKWKITLELEVTDLIIHSCCQEILQLVNNSKKE